MTDDHIATIARTGLRLSLGTAFLSAVAGRLGLWGAADGNWQGFLHYVAELNWFLPPSLIPAAGIASTILETTFAGMLIAGWRVRWAAFGSATLLIIFALCMATGTGLKSPFDYSVFTAAFAALLLATKNPKEKII